MRFRLLSVPTNGSLGILSRSSDEGNEKSEKERFKGSGQETYISKCPGESRTRGRRLGTKTKARGRVDKMKKG